MSKIIRGQTSESSFVDSLEGASALRHELLRKVPTSMTARDIRREEARAEGYGIGFEEGKKEGEKQGRQQAYAQSKAELDRAHAAQIQQFSEGINATMQEFQDQKAEWFTQTEEQLSDLAIEIARRAIAKELEQSRECVVGLAHQVLDEVTESTKIKLRVNPIDGSVMEARKTEIEAAFSNLENITIVEDRSVGFGCKLETDSGMIDARVEDYLARIIAEGREGR